MDEFKQYLQYQKEVAQATLKIVERFQKESKRQPAKRTSNIFLVENILKKANKPLHVTEIIRIAEKDHQIPLNRDSIVSAILKKINAGKTFIRTGPNTFALNTTKQEEGL